MTMLASPTDAATIKVGFPPQLQQRRAEAVLEDLVVILDHIARGDLPIVFPPKTKNSARAKFFSDLAPSAINLRRQPQSTTSISNSTQQPPIDRHPCHQIAEPPAPESVDVSSRAHGEYYSPCALVGKNRVSAVLAAKNTIKYSFDMFSIVIESAFRSSTPPTR